MKSFKMVEPYPGIIINENVKFVPGEYDFRGSDGIIVGADNITIDGNGAVIKGGISKSAAPDAQTNVAGFGCNSLSDKCVKDNGADFCGIGVQSQGHSGVCIKNLRIMGFDIGLYAKNGIKWLIEGNDFSDNFTDPDWGWDDHGFHGGILLEHIHESTIRRNKSTNVWDALNLRYSNRNIVENNDLSHVTDVCLKLWNSSQNYIIENDLSYGIRIKPGEVHARDSSGVLIESGSNENIFKRNDVTHGGDGIFIRVLNGWMSIGNYFEQNDCSYANNNAIEAWAYGNSYVRNKANYSSYGFWLGGSDNTLLLENEVAYNGTVFCNAPEYFGNAGISIVNNSGSHLKIIGNHIHDNNGPGIAIRYNPDYPSYHIVIEKNIIEGNKNYRNFKGHGIYLKNAQWINIAGNDINNNEGEAVFLDDNTSDIFIKQANNKDNIPYAEFTVNSKSIEVSDEVVFDGTPSKSRKGSIEYRWDFGDGVIETGKMVSHKYDKPGFYRMGLMVNDGGMADISFKNIYVNYKGEETGTEDAAANWGYAGDDNNAVLKEDRVVFVSGDHSLCLLAECGTNHKLFYPADKNAGIDLREKDLVAFYIKFQSDSETDWQKTNKKPIIRLCTDDNNYFEYVPCDAYLEQMFSKISEQKYGWKYFEIYLREPAGWECKTYGSPELGNVNCIEIEEGPFMDSKSEFWIDGLKFVSCKNEIYYGVDIARNLEHMGFPEPICSSHGKGSDAFAPLSGSMSFYGSRTERWFPATGDTNSWYGVDFGIKREFDRLDVYFYNNPADACLGTVNLTPDAFKVECWDDSISEYIELAEIKNVCPNLNVVTFKKVLSSKVRIVMDSDNGSIPSIYAFNVYNTKNAAGELNRNGKHKTSISSSKPNTLGIKKIGLKLNKEHNEKETALSSLIVRLYETEGGILKDRILFEVEVLQEEVAAGKETLIDFPYSGLVPYNKYAIGLTQKQIAKSRTEGDYYRWCTSQTENGEHFGVLNGNAAKDETADWGTGWLKIYTDKMVLDYSHTNEGLGNRFGLCEQECRWQTFTAADSVLCAADGSSTIPGWVPSIGNENHIEMVFNEKIQIESINLYYGADPNSKSIMDCIEFELLNDGLWDKTKYDYEFIDEGFVKAMVSLKYAEALRIKINDSNGSIKYINEIEVERV